MYNTFPFQRNSDETDLHSLYIGVMMYRIRPGCAVYARMGIQADQARRMMYIGVRSNALCSLHHPRFYE